MTRQEGPALLRPDEVARRGMHEDVPLTEMEVRDGRGVVVNLQAVFFVHDDRYCRILVADFKELPEELDCRVSPIGMFGRGSLGKVEEEPMSDLSPVVGFPVGFPHAAPYAALSDLTIDRNPYPIAK
ncbi:MAG TPA: hypothetical protein VGZ73_17035 [Bryobacteraceae bacterium]|jgi:hypothetical protein|nr:hypothetical protein [Bryobacteraceae bacterium]